MIIKAYPWIKQNNFVLPHLINKVSNDLKLRFTIQPFQKPRTNRNFSIKLTILIKLNSEELSEWGDAFHLKKFQILEKNFILFNYI